MFVLPCVVICDIICVVISPLQVRMANIVLSFFEPTDTDPKPCKSSSPDSKSDSGIDLTNDRAPSTTITESGQSLQSHVVNNFDSDDDYEGDTSGTETDNDPFDEDYFLDMGIGELMLQSTEHLELASSDSSTWCSNLSKFSEILETLPSTDNSRQYKAMTSAGLSDDDNYDDITKSILSLNELKENSDTESQMVSTDHLSDGLESDDEFMCKPVAQTDMNHYYLSATTDTNTVE